MKYFLPMTSKLLWGQRDLRTASCLHVAFISSSGPGLHLLTTEQMAPSVLSVSSLWVLVGDFGAFQWPLPPWSSLFYSVAVSAAMDLVTARRHYDSLIIKLDPPKPPHVFSSSVSWTCLLECSWWPHFLLFPLFLSPYQSLPLFLFTFNVVSEVPLFKPLVSCFLSYFFRTFFSPELCFIYLHLWKPVPCSGH